MYSNCNQNNIGGINLHNNNKSISSNNSNCQLDPVFSTPQAYKSPYLNLQQKRKRLRKSIGKSMRSMMVYSGVKVKNEKKQARNLKLY